MDEPEPSSCRSRTPSTSTPLHRGTCAPSSRSISARRPGEAFSEVRLIHGRGNGIQRAIVRGLLARHPLVARFFTAPAERGGWGATVAILKAPDQPSSGTERP